MLHSSEGVKVSVLRNRYNEFTACLCGVRARGDEQFAPILDALPGTVYAYHAEGADAPFQVNNLISAVLDDLHYYAVNGFPINLVGASLGGMIVPFIVAALRVRHPDYDLANMTVVLLDAPFGAASFKDPVAKLLKLGPLASAAALLAQAAHLETPVDKPKAEDTDADPALMGLPAGCTSAEAMQAIEEGTVVATTGHPWSLFIRQLRWMVEVGSDGSLAHACEFMDGMKIVYIVCGRGDNPVVHDLTVNWWRLVLPQMEVISVYGTHVGFLQNTEKFLSALFSVFRWNARVSS